MVESDEAMSKDYSFINETKNKEAPHIHLRLSLKRSSLMIQSKFVQHLQPPHSL